MTRVALTDAAHRHRSSLEAVERMVGETLGSEYRTLDGVARHLLGAGGKLMRPMLCLLAAEVGGSSRRDAEVLGVAVELVHAASLCHDDVLDGGEVRRGRATVRAQYGDAMSILLGDVCLARAFEVLVRRGLCEPASRLAAAVVAMAEGEVRQATELLGAQVSVQAYLEVAEAKTGALLCWCLTCGGMMPGDFLAPMEEYGRALGRAYQIADDLIDLEQDDESGKAVGQDLWSGRPSLPILLAAGTPDALGRRVREALDDRRLYDLSALVSDLRESKAVETARELADAEARRAVEALSTLPRCAALEDLRALARFAVTRRG